MSTKQKKGTDELQPTTTDSVTEPTPSAEPVDPVQVAADELAETAPIEPSSGGSGHSCGCCAATNTVFVFSKDDAQWHKCNVCGSITAEKPDSIEVNVNANAADRNEEPRNQARLHRLLSLGTVKKVLDFGCGNGEFVDYANAQGIQALGFDPVNPKYAQQPGDRFDAIVITEVLGQLVDPVATLKGLKASLYKNGLVMVEDFMIDSIHEEYWSELEQVTASTGNNFIASYKGLMKLMTLAGYHHYKSINRNVFVFQRD